jgi:hypothetical protein
VPLQNRPRQRRSYLSLSAAWYERAILAEHFASLDPAFASLASCLHAARLDCLLEAAIASWDLDVVSPGEERLLWWWIEQISCARSSLSLPETWESTWAGAWGCLSQGMQAVSNQGVCSIQLFPFIPISEEQFAMRFKWAHKADKLASREHWNKSATPTWNTAQCFARAVSLFRKLTGQAIDQHYRVRFMLM